MDDFKKRDEGYDAFFQSKPNGDESTYKSDAANDEPSDKPNAYQSDAGQEQKQSYYYSYGPFKSMEQQGHSAGNDHEVEIRKPSPVRAYQPQGEQQERPARSWEYQQPKRRSSARSMFAAFLAGALVVGSLMVVSDRMNLFTPGNQSAFAGSSPTAGAGSTSGGSGGSGGSAAADSGVKGASYSIDRPDNISAIVKQASPAVVKVENFQKVSASQNNPFFDDPFFSQFFGDNSLPGGGNNRKQQQNSAPQEVGFGSGFFFDKSGLILTNEHVIDGADQVKVEVMGQKDPLIAKVLGKSYDLDLAVLKVQGNNDFPYLKLDDSNNVNVGDWLVAIGNPYGFDHTVTVGVLSATEREIPVQDENGTRQYKHLLQTDASINPGNSGGPLLDTEGNVIGINTAVSAQAQGIGFAIPTSTIAQVLDRLKNNQDVSTPAPYIGVELLDIQPQWVKMLKLDSTDGAFVHAVSYDSPAYRAGLREYDVITAVNGEKIKNSDDVVKKVQAMKPGDKATFTVSRSGQSQDLKVTIGDKNDFQQSNQ